jgi:F0F1-type ATP synthase assembly protein I
MQEKFFNLSKGLRWVIVVATWLLTVVGFVGCLMVKQYTELPWLEIILTLVGMLFCVVAICLTIVQLTNGEHKSESEE